jgi:hypothetical protein
MKKFLIATLIIFLGFPLFAFGAIEDFSTYTIVDAGNYISVTSTAIISYSGLPPSLSYVYSDKGVDHFSGDFEHLVDIQQNSHTDVSANITIWLLANALDITDCP